MGLEAPFGEGGGGYWLRGGHPKKGGGGGQAGGRGRVQGVGGGWALEPWAIVMKVNTVGMGLGLLLVTCTSLHQ